LYTDLGIDCTYCYQIYIVSRQLDTIGQFCKSFIDKLVKAGASAQRFGGL
jgi:hypothetical protein